MASHSNSLVSIWRSFPSTPFDEWVPSVSNTVMNNGLGVVRSARLIGVQPAELLAVLKLASLDPIDLAEFNDRIPPRTTWLALADARRDEIMNCLDLLKTRPGGFPPSKLISQNIHSENKVDEWDAVLAIKSDTLKHMHYKAGQYKCLNDRALKALNNFAQNKKHGKSFSFAQAQFLQNILKDMANSGAISRNSRDKDQEECDEVLNALGMP
jgi:hypothetical protein